MANELQSVSVRPGYAIPGWSLNDLAVGEFINDELKCPIPGCSELFKNDAHGRRYAAEKWKAHVISREAHYFLWFDSRYCYQPRALYYTFIRVDSRHNIAVCHFRREPVQFSKLTEHCSRCKGCLGIDTRFENEPEFQSIRNVTKQQLQRDGVAIQGFEACEAFHCCRKLYGSSVQGIHAHLKTPGDHEPTGPVKCMRYRTTKHGYAYVPISDLEYDKLNAVHDGMSIKEKPSKSDWERLQKGEDVAHRETPQNPSHSKLHRPEAEYQHSPNQHFQNQYQNQNQSQNPNQHVHSQGQNQNQDQSRALIPGKALEPQKEQPQPDKYHTVESFRLAVISEGYGLFEKFYFSLAQSCIQKLNKITWNHQANIVTQWPVQERIFDDMARTVPGYSFLADSRNPHGTSQYALLHIAHSAPIQLFKNGLKSPDVEAYMDKCDDFLRHLMVLIYCSIANTPSPSELLRYAFSNTTDSERNMLIFKQQVLLRTGITYSEKYLPWITGEILVRYLAIVRPFEIYLAQGLGYHQEDIREMQTYIFRSIRSKLSECDLADSMRLITSEYLDKATSEHVWKSLLHTIMGGVSSKQWSVHTFSLAWFNSTGLNRMDLERLPGLGTKATLNTVTT